MVSILRANTTLSLGSKHAQQPLHNGIVHRIWRAEIPVRAALLGVYPVMIVLSVAQWLALNRAPPAEMSTWKHDTLTSVSCVLFCLLFFAGSLIALRALAHAAKRHPWKSRLGQLVILLIAIPVAVDIAGSQGFVAGYVLRTSFAAALGTAYGYRVPDDGTELEFIGELPRSCSGI